MYSAGVEGATWTDSRIKRSVPALRAETKLSGSFFAHLPTRTRNGSLPPTARGRARVQDGMCCPWKPWDSGNARSRAAMQTASLERQRGSAVPHSDSLLSVVTRPRTSDRPVKNHKYLHLCMKYFAGIRTKILPTVVSGW